MSIIATFIIFLMGIFGGFFTSSLGGSQASARDAERKTDINNIYMNLEIHYNEYGYYPTEDQLSTEPAKFLTGVDEEALIDPNGKRLNENGGDYKYVPNTCNATTCEIYTLTTTLEKDSDYVKISLN